MEDDLTSERKRRVGALDDPGLHAAERIDEQGRAGPLDADVRNDQEQPVGPNKAH